MTPALLLLRVSLLIANHSARDYISQADEKLAETLIALCHDHPPWCEDPADLDPERGYPRGDGGYSEVRNPNGSHR